MTKLKKIFRYIPIFVTFETILVSCILFDRLFVENDKFMQTFVTAGVVVLLLEKAAKEINQRLENK